MFHHSSGASAVTAADHDAAGVAFTTPTGGDIGPYGVALIVVELPAADVPLTVYIEVKVNE